MRHEVKKLLEMAAIDLGYAKLEVAFADQTTGALSRVGHHLNELEKYLNDLAGAIERDDAGADELEKSA